MENRRPAFPSGHLLTTNINRLPKAMRRGDLSCVSIAAARVGLPSSRTADGARQAYFQFDWNLDPARVALPPARLTMLPAQSIDVQVVDGSGTPVADAMVGVVVDYRGLETGHSDQYGKYTLRIPAKAPLQNIYALKSGLGLDYLSFPAAGRVSPDLPQPPDLSRPLILQLKGATTIRIKLIDTEGRPIEGIPVGPWYLQKPEWGPLDMLNIGGVKDFQKKSDAAGMAVFDWIPSWNKQSIFFWPSGGDRWARDRIAWDPGITRKIPPKSRRDCNGPCPFAARCVMPTGLPLPASRSKRRETGNPSIIIGAKLGPTKREDMSFGCFPIRFTFSQ